jgi:hypothetical protein
MVGAGISTQGPKRIKSTRSNVIFGFPASSVGRRPGLQAVIPHIPNAMIVITNNNRRIRNLLLKIIWQ